MSDKRFRRGFWCGVAFPPLMAFITWLSAWVDENVTPRWVGAAFWLLVMLILLFIFFLICERLAATPEGSQHE